MIKTDAIRRALAALPCHRLDLGPYDEATDGGLIAAICAAYSLTYDGLVVLACLSNGLPAHWDEVDVLAESRVFITDPEAYIPAELAALIRAADTRWPDNPTLATEAEGWHRDDAPTEAWEEIALALGLIQADFPARKPGPPLNFRDFMALARAAGFGGER